MVFCLLSVSSHIEKKHLIIRIMLKKRLVKSVWQLLLFAVLLIHISCSKDNIFSANSPSIELSGIGAFSGISVENGMLVFSSQDQLDNAIDGIIEFESELKEFLDDLYGDSYPEHARYEAIISANGPFGGLNPITGGDLGTFSGEEIEKINDDPIKYLFEYSFQYYSLRKYLEDETYLLHTTEAFNGSGNDPDDHFIPDDYLRMILNDKLEVKVGTKTYKVVSSTAILVMETPTILQLEETRNAFSAPLSYSTIPVFPNKGGVLGNPAVYSYSGTDVIDFMGPQGTQTCTADFTFTVDPILITTVSFNMNASGYTSFSWAFGDGGVSTSTNPTHTYSQNGTYYVTLTLYDGAVVCDMKTKIVTISSGCVADFHYSINQGAVSFVDDSRSNSSTAFVANWDWDFGDGSPIVNGLANPTHTYTTSGTYQVCLYITTSDNCVENHCDWVTVSLECCKTNKTVVVGSGSNPVEIGNNRGYKGKLWITSIPIYNRAGSKIKCYRKKSNNNWVLEKADEISTGGLGNIYSNDCESLIGNQQSDWYDVDTDKNSLTVVTSGAGQVIKTRLGELFANFYLDDNGIVGQGSASLLEPTDCD